MTTSQKSFLSDVLNADRIPVGKLAYFRGRLINRIHALVIEEFDRLSKAGKINKAQLAKRIGREPAQVTRWLGSPGNWTIETLSDLLLAMKCEPSISILSLAYGQVGESHASIPVKQSTNQTAGRSEPIHGTIASGERVEGTVGIIMIPMQHTETARRVSHVN